MNTITIWLMISFSNFGAIPTILERFATKQDCINFHDQLGRSQKIICIEAKVLKP